MHRDTDGGRVQRDTVPIIRCIYWRVWINTLVKSHVRTTTTTHTHTPATHTTPHTTPPHHTPHTTPPHPTPPHPTTTTTPPTHPPKPPSLPSPPLSTTTTTTSTQGSNRLCCFFGSLSFDLNGWPMAERGDAGGGTGSGRRRRERRLRSMLRHERMAVAMALAESLHHGAQRPEKARAGEVEEQDKHPALRREKSPPLGKRPGVPEDPVPQGRVGQHCGVGFELVQALDVPVLQISFLHAFLLRAEPRHSSSASSWWSSSSRFSPSAFGGVSSLVKAFVVFSQDRVQQRLPTFLLPAEVFRVYTQDRVQQRLSSFPPLQGFAATFGDVGEGFFRTFPRVKKKVRRLVLAPGRNWPRTRAVAW